MSFHPLEADKKIGRGKRGSVVKPCPVCGKLLRAKSEKQWEYVALAHKALSKKHRLKAENG